MKKTYFILLLVFLVIVLNSCLGLSYDIQMNRSGSGSITIEYRFSSMMGDLGSLDGNELLATIPVSLEDWQKSMDRIQDAKLVSHSISETGMDSVVTVVIDFDTPDALAQVMDSQGDSITISFNGQNGSLEYIIHDDSAEKYDASTISLMRSFFSGYNFVFNFRANTNSVMAITDRYGNIINAPPSADVTASGRRVSFSMGIMDVLMTDGLGLKVNW